MIMHILGIGLFALVEQEVLTGLGRLLLSCKAFFDMLKQLNFQWKHDCI